MEVDGKPIRKEVEENDQGWTPVLQGEIYCSPACDAGCTKAAFDEATRKAEALAKALGPNWTPDVWENLGWYHCAALRKSVVTVHPEYRGNQGYWTHNSFLFGEGVLSAPTIEELREKMIERIKERQKVMQRRLEQLEEL